MLMSFIRNRYIAQSSLLERFISALLKMNDVVRKRNWFSIKENINIWWVSILSVVPFDKENSGSTEMKPSRPLVITE